MEDFDFELMPPDLDFGPVAEAGEKTSTTLFWIAILVIGVVLGALLYHLLKEEPPERKVL